MTAVDNQPDPILPEWARDRETFRTASRNLILRSRHRTAKFVVNLPPLLFWLAVVYPWRGIVRLTARVSRYLYDYDSAMVRHEHAGRMETSEYKGVQKERRANLHARWMVAATVAVIVVGPPLAWTFPKVLSGIVGLVLAVWIIKIIPGRGMGEVVIAAVTGVAVYLTGPYALAMLPRPATWIVAAVLAAGWLGLGWVGRPQNKPLVKDTGLAPGVVAALRAPMVREALCQIGVAGMKDPEDIRLLMDVHRHGPGVQVDLDVPVAAAEVVKRREKLAAALKRELGCVWPSVGRRHAAHLVLYVADEPMVSQMQRPWPLADGGQVDIFKPAPMFTGQRGEWVSTTFAYANMIVGAQPRMGKSFLLRQALLVAALDPRTRIYALDGKGTGDLAALRLVAHFYSVGDDPEEVEDRVLPAMRALRDEMRRRAKLIRELDREECPESKVTSDLVDRFRDLAPVVIGIDETQAYFGYGDAKNKNHKAIREELTAIVTDLVKRGPALGFITILATQNVCEETIPRQISLNAVIRVALKLFDHTANDQVLGTGAYSKGTDATVFDIDDKGIAIVRADGSEPQVVRSVVGLDAVRSESLAALARSARSARGLLTGEAAGEDAETEAVQVDLLDDARHVMGNPVRPTVHLAGLLDSLAAMRPALYGHMDVFALGAALRGAGVPVRTVWVPGTGDGKGIKREWLDVAATQDADPDDEAV